jgi:hypothetical protein
MGFYSRSTGIDRCARSQGVNNLPSLAFPVSRPPRASPSPLLVYQRNLFSFSSRLTRHRQLTCSMRRMVGTLWTFYRTLASFFGSRHLGGRQLDNVSRVFSRGNVGTFTHSARGPPNVLSLSASLVRQTLPIPPVRRHLSPVGARHVSGGVTTFDDS